MPTLYHGANGDIYLFDNLDSNYLTQHNNDLKTIIDHNHTSNPIHGTTAIQAGTITAASITDGTITSAKLAASLSVNVIANNTYLKWRNNANNADVSVMRLNTSDKLEIATDVAAFRMINNTYMKGATAAAADFNTWKVNASDQWEWGNTAYSQTITPKTDSTYDLGTSSLYYQRAYLDNLQFSASGNYDLDYFKYVQDTDATTQGGTSAGSGTYTVRKCGHMRLGKWCHFWGAVRTTAHTGTGSLQLQLPYNTSAFTGDNRSGWASFTHDTTESITHSFSMSPSSAVATASVLRTGGASQLSVVAAQNFTWNFWYETA